jgi:hypothetical protein
MFICGDQTASDTARAVVKAKTEGLSSCWDAGMVFREMEVVSRRQMISDVSPCMAIELVWSTSQSEPH